MGRELTAPLPINEQEAKPYGIGDQFPCAMDPRVFGGYIGVRLLGVTEPGFNDRLTIGSEFWTYRQERLRS